MTRGIRESAQILFSVDGLRRNVAISEQGRSDVMSRSALFISSNAVLLPMISVAFTDVFEDGTAACRHLSDKPHLL